MIVERILTMSDFDLVAGWPVGNLSCNVHVSTSAGLSTAEVKMWTADLVEAGVAEAVTGLYNELMSRPDRRLRIVARKPKSGTAGLVVAGKIVTGRLDHDTTPCHAITLQLVAVTVT